MKQQELSVPGVTRQVTDYHSHARARRGQGSASEGSLQSLEVAALVLGGKQPQAVTGATPRRPDLGPQVLLTGQRVASACSSEGTCTSFRYPIILLTPPASPWKRLQLALQLVSFLQV